MLVGVAGGALVVNGHLTSPHAVGPEVALVRLDRRVWVLLAHAVRHDGHGQLHLLFLSLSGMHWHTARRSNTAGSVSSCLATRALTARGTPGWESL